MEIWIGIGNAVVVAAVGLILGWLGKGRFEALEKRMDRLEAHVDVEIRDLRSSVQGSIDGLRSDLTAVALAVGVPRGPRRMS